MVLMKKVKQDGVTVNRDGALFNNLVQIGKLTANNVHSFIKLPVKKMIETRHYIACNQPFCAMKDDKNSLN